MACPSSTPTDSIEDPALQYMGAPTLTACVRSHSQADTTGIRVRVTPISCSVLLLASNRVWRRISRIASKRPRFPRPWNTSRHVHNYFNAFGYKLNWHAAARHPRRTTHFDREIVIFPRLCGRQPVLRHRKPAAIHQAPPLLLRVGHKPSPNLDRVPNRS